MQRIALLFTLIFTSISLLADAPLTQTQLRQLKRFKAAKKALNHRLKFRLEQDGDETLNGWQFKDPDAGIEGSSIDLVYRDYEIVENEKPIIVAVIDTGVNIYHKALKGKIWVNPGEAGGQEGVDDDGNGYIDDYYGWNFLGDVYFDQLELTREYVRLRNRYQFLDPAKIKTDPEYSYYLKLKATHENEVGVSLDHIDALKRIKEHLEKLIAIVWEKAKLENSDLRKTSKIISKLENITDPMSRAGKAKDTLLFYFTEIDYANLGNEIASYESYFSHHYYNINFRRERVAGDNPRVFVQKSYGDNNVIGPDPKHGTHVAGTIAAGGFSKAKGVAYGANIKIMPIRAIPNGDERDKDIANAIYYAVDMGAHIINMSFGKDFAPFGGARMLNRGGELVGKAGVDQAIAYAESKGVIIIHAAGNDGREISFTSNFPNKMNLITGKEVSTWLEIGASTWTKGSQYNGEYIELAASFSNTGQRTVDLFAPGKAIFAAVSENSDDRDSYIALSGTSMATPIVSGGIALFLSQKETWDAEMVVEQVKSSVRTYHDYSQDWGGSNISFKKLSETGGVFDLKNFFDLAL